MSFMLSSGDTLTTLRELDRVIVPEPTKSWRPVRHSVLINRTVDAFQEAFNLELRSMQIGQARKGLQVFAKMDFALPNAEMGPSVALRNSYDKSYKFDVAVGANVFVCSNGCFSGDSGNIGRKHTSRIMDDIDALLAEAAKLGMAKFQATVLELDAFKAANVTLDEGYGHLGIMQGRGVLRPQEVTEAMRYWTDAPHAEHKVRNLFGLYQAANHGLKRAHPALAMESFAGLHKYAREAKEGMFTHPVA